jgi:hypothetical protein
MNKFHKHIAKKFYSNADIDEATVGEARRFAEIIDYICKAQRNACARVYEADYISRGGYNIYDYINTAEIKGEDYE